MKTWFTADTHFGHKRIIELCNRPFSSVEQMDEALIANWNARVGHDDIVWHLGDFAFADHDLYLPRLNGKSKYLIKGNHDHKNRVSKMGWDLFIASPYYEAMVEEQFLVLCHYGLRVWNKSHHGAIHLYGHSHGNLPGDSACCDVGVDCWDFKPISLDEIKARLAMLPKRVEPDHHKTTLQSCVLTAS